MLEKILERLAAIEARLSTIEQQLSTTAKRVLNVDEAAEYLEISKGHLYKLASAGIVPFSKPSGKRIYFDRDRLDGWKLSNASMSSHEKDIRAATYVTTHKMK